MNKTRQEIINIIEPFMDKTLSEGCLYEFDNEIYTMSKNEALNSSAFLESQEAGDTVILGIYDITAVLKYINLKINGEGSEYFMYIYNEKILIYNKFIKDVIKINPKPLHLYTEQEEKDLLDLLLKLK